MKFTGTLLTLLVFVSTVVAQEMSGVITYEQVVDYGLDSFEPPGGGNPERNARMQSMLAELPKKGTAVHRLTFNEKYALYEEMEPQEAMDPQLERFLSFQRRFNPPIAESIMMMYDFDKDVRTDVFEFMTRTFEMDHPLNNPSWKMTTERKQVGEYICFGAQSTTEEGLVAWFSPQLPLPAGPGEYSGLPGIVLAIEKDEEIILMATSIELQEVDFSTKPPKDAKKVTEEEFAVIEEEKTAEFIEQRELRRQQFQQGGGRPQGGRPGGRPGGND